MKALLALVFTYVFLSAAILGVHAAMPMDPTTQLGCAIAMTTSFFVGLVINATVPLK